MRKTSQKPFPAGFSCLFVFIALVLLMTGVSELTVLRAAEGKFGIVATAGPEP